MPIHAWRQSHILTFAVACAAAQRIGQGIVMMACCSWLTTAIIAGFSLACRAITCRDRLPIQYHRNGSVGSMSMLRLMTDCEMYLASTERLVLCVDDHATEARRSEYVVLSR